MCLNLSRFRPLHVYQHPFNCTTVTAGCGKCVECREIQRNEWVNRLCFEYDSNVGGLSLFLTFTYNNEHLPRFSYKDFSTLCFNHDDVKRFLKSLENYYYFRFKSKPYKYFFCSEYGKTTQRPHYHVTFFLFASIAPMWREFVEVCREIWSTNLSWLPRLTDKQSMHLGYMFPLRTVDGRYVDQKGNDRTPLIQSGVKGMTYVSKYATKDISFYSDDINNFLSSADGWRLRPFLPKHWQSKKLGYSAVDVALKDVDYAMHEGIVNPLSKRLVPLPHYVVNKLLYVNVWRGRTRYDEKTGKIIKLYDRELSDLGRVKLASYFEFRVRRMSTKMYEFFFNLMHGNFKDIDCPSDLPSLLSSSRVGVATDSSVFIPLALYHCFYKNFDSVLFSYALDRFDGVLDDLLSINPRVLSLYTVTKDQNFKRLYKVDFAVHADLTNERVFGSLPRLDSIFCELSRKISSQLVSLRVKKREDSYATKEKLTHGYDINLC